jgi:RNA-binding protein
MSTKTIGGKALRHLRALGHTLDPVIAVGKGGITDALVAEAKLALARHELIKVRVMTEAPVDRKDAAAALAEATSATLAQVLGRTFLLYRRNPQKSKIALPGDKPEKPTGATATENDDAPKRTTSKKSRPRSRGLKKKSRTRPDVRGR